MDAVKQVDLIIGELSGVQIDSLQFALNALSPGTPLEHARFAFNTPGLKLSCNQCGNTYIAAADDLICPACLQADFKVLEGNEMMVKAIYGEKKSNG